MDIDEKTNEKHERKEQKPKKSETKDQFSSKGFKFGHFQSRRKPVFHNFTKDLIQNLPE